MYYLINYI